MSFSIGATHTEKRQEWTVKDKSRQQEKEKVTPHHPGRHPLYKKKVSAVKGNPTPHTPPIHGCTSKVGYSQGGRTEQHG